MRLLHLDAGREMRGGQWQVLRLLEGLAGEGVESILLARRGSTLFERARKSGLRVEPLRLTNLVALSRQADLLHAHDARSHTLAAFLPRPLIVSRRVAFPVGSRWKYGRARRYIAVSSHVKTVLVAGGVPEEKIAVVYDGVPLLQQAEGTAILAPANAGDPQKGAGLALAAARLAGVTLEFSTDLERDLPGAALLVYISYSEGLGSAALLAMAAGVPVVASDVGGLREIIRHRENGLLVANSADAIAGAIRELAGNPELARHLGEAARQTIKEHFTIDMMVRRTCGIYREVLS